MRLPTEGSALRAYRMAQRDEHPLPADHTLLTTLPGWSPINPPSPSSSSSSSSSTTRNYNDYQHHHHHSRNQNSYSEMDGNQFHGNSISGGHLDSSGSASNDRASATASLLERQEYLDRMKKLRETVLAT